MVTAADLLATVDAATVVMGVAAALAAVLAFNVRQVLAEVRRLGVATAELSGDVRGMEGELRGKLADMDRRVARLEDRFFGREG